MHDRLTQVYVDKKYFPNYKKVPKLLQQFCQNVNSRIAQVQTAREILKLAADTYYNVVNIHPFANGNGRTARLLMNYIQLFHSEPLIKVFTEDRNTYIDALNTTEAQQDQTIFRDFIAQQQIKFYQVEIDKFQRKDKGFTFLF